MFSSCARSVPLGCSHLGHQKHLHVNLLQLQQASLWFDFTTFQSCLGHPKWLCTNYECEYGDGAGV